MSRKRSESSGSGVSAADSSGGHLFDRIVAILEQARGNVVRAVNSGTVIAYWLIGREIVTAAQGGDERAEYGGRVIVDLAARLTQRYGRGFSVPNLKRFRQFYLTYRDRAPTIGSTPWSPFADGLSPAVTAELPVHEKAPQRGANSSAGFHSALSWSHYRILMRVENLAARAFYEAEVAAAGWGNRQLERQVHSLYYERLLKSQDRHGMLLAGRKPLEAPPDAMDVLKDPYVLEFLDLPEWPCLHESGLEEAIVTNLQAFLLELGKGFAFVARQKRMRFDDQDFYVDLVFYHCILKCYVLIDLKIGALTHQDIGQMDGYVRMFDEQGTNEGDNPTIGLILCSEKNEAIVKYSVLSESRQLFAAKYLACLPSEQELRRELMRERQLIEARRDKNEGAE
jgi:predicted nuclease of restriction endonuclease-like (RecB) superfamily